MKTCEALSCKAGVAMPTVLPGLNPNQPIQRMKTPSVAMVRLCPRMARGFPFLYFPMRGPTSAAPTSASHPPTECTTADPAKSWKPRAASQPPPQVQCPASG